MSGLTELRIHPFIVDLPYEPEIDKFDFTTIGLVSKSPIYSLTGEKLWHDYVDVEGAVCVRKKFKYSPTTVTITICWHTIDGVCGVTKVVSKPITSMEYSALQTKNRQRVVHRLIASTEGSEIAVYFQSLLSFYRNQLADWVQSGNTTPLVAKLNNSGSISIDAILDTKIEVPIDGSPNNTRVRDIILAGIV